MFNTSEYITIKEAKEKNLIPKVYHEYIIDNCYGCGSPMITSKNLRKQMCSNNRCKMKLAGRIIKMLNKFGIIGIGRSFATKFVELNQCCSHIQILVATEEELRTTGYYAKAVTLKKEIDKVLSERYTFAEVLSKLALPGIDDTALKVFRHFYNYNVFKQFLAQMDLDIMDYLVSIDGIGKTKAEQIINVLSEYELEIEYISKIFKLRVPGKGVFKIVMTGNLDYYGMSKAIFIKYLNRVFEGYATFEWTPEAVTTADFVVTAEKYLPTRIIREDGSFDERKHLYDFKTVEPSIYMSRKHRKAIEVAKKINYDYIVKPEELVEIIKTMVEKGEL